MHCTAALYPPSLQHYPWLILPGIPFKYYLVTFGKRLRICISNNVIRNMSLKYHFRVLKTLMHYILQL